MKFNGERAEGKGHLYVTDTIIWRAIWQYQYVKLFDPGVLFLVIPTKYSLECTGIYTYKDVLYSTFYNHKNMAQRKYPCRRRGMIKSITTHPQ